MEIRDVGGGDGPRLLHDMVDAACQARPGATAVRDREGRWDYAELSRQSHGYAAWLRSRGVAAGDRVLVEAGPDRRVLAVLFACSRLGAIFVPVGDGATLVQWTHYVADCEPALIVTDVAELAESNPGVTDTATAWAQASAFSGERYDGPPVPPTSAALLIYTSGSVAAPKAVICPHAQVVFAACRIAARLRYDADDVVFCRLPLSFDYGLYQAFLAALAGAELVLCGADADARLLAEVRRHGATVVPVVPALASMLIRLAGRDRRPTRVRLFTNTGEELPAASIDALRQRFPGAGVQLMFGITECKRVSVMEVDADRERRGAVGRPLDDTWVQILGPAGSALPAGSAGEIVVFGPHVMAGYWRDEALTARVFGRDPVTGQRCLYTGDIGHLDADGYLYFHGRRDQIFKRHGVRTSALEIEAAAQDIPGVAEAAVVPPAGDTDAVLCVVASIGAAEVLRCLRERLDAARVPARCLVVDRLPRLGSGKLDRAGLPALIDRTVRR
ncbi:class I adenylate-forming enzyme family protein [Dactylosporangium sp. CA-139066]|uniref:class I adenylate-forming enzyme family protein n=1 Tax=Dactylosporangium sp. CA-139066 TaxID=3239930 RepID=UPI003D8AFB93